jgi:hypothetical protein
MWLHQAMNREGLVESALLDHAALSPYFSKKDLECYDSLVHDARAYFERTLGVTVPGHDEAPVYLDRPLNCYCSNAMERTVNELEGNDDSDMTYNVIGRHLPVGFQWSFNVRPLNGIDGSDAVGLFAYTFEGTSEDKVAADKMFLSQLLQLLYAHNLTIDKLAMTGLLGAYVKRLG